MNFGSVHGDTCINICRNELDGENCERQGKVETTATTSGENTLPPSLFTSPVHATAKEEVEGGLSHTHTSCAFLSSPFFFSFFFFFVAYLFCGVASGRLGLTHQPSIRSCAHADQETLLHTLSSSFIFIFFFSLFVLPTWGPVRFFFLCFLLTLAIECCL